MSITNLPKPTTSISNAIKISDMETWATITTTWATETRTWIDTISLMENDTKVSANITNVNKPA